RPQDRGQTLLLFDVVEAVGVVAAPAVCHHHPVVVRGNDLLHFLRAMLGADLIDGGRVGLERHQVGGVAPDAPACVIRVYDRLGWGRRPPWLGGRTDRGGGGAAG